MRTVTVHEAKTHLSRLIQDVLEGKDVVIARGKNPVVKLVPLESVTAKRNLGWLRGDSRGSDPLAYGFWDPIPDVDLALWSGELDYPDDPADAPPA